MLTSLLQAVKAALSWIWATFFPSPKQSPVAVPVVCGNLTGNKAPVPVKDSGAPVPVKDSGAPVPVKDSGDPVPVKDSGAPDNEDDLVDIVVLSQSGLLPPTTMFEWDPSVSYARWSDHYDAVEHFRQCIKYHAAAIKSDFSNAYVPNPYPRQLSHLAM
jgi:hypothetical protein